MSLLLSLSDAQYCAAGMLLGLPLSIHKKSYWPVALAAAAGTAADFKEVSERRGFERPGRHICAFHKPRLLRSSGCRSSC